MSKSCSNNLLIMCISRCSLPRTKLNGIALEPCNYLFIIFFCFLFAVLYQWKCTPVMSVNIDLISVCFLIFFFLKFTTIVSSVVKFLITK